jgi:hypothetical protein
MTVSETHINLGILLQKVNTHRSKNFLPQELDMLFNLTLNTFKNKKTDLLSNPRQVSLFDTHTSLDNLSNLFETETLYPITNNKEEAIVLLPFNFYGWINARALVAYDCPASVGTEVKNNTFTSQFIYNLKDIKLSGLTSFILDISYSNESNNTITTTTVFDYTKLPEDYLSQDNVKDYIQSFIFIQALIKTMQLGLDKININRVNKLYIKYDNQTEALVLSTNGILNLILETNDDTINTIKKESIVPIVSLVNTFNSPITTSDTEYEPFINNSRLSGGTIADLRAVRTSKELKIKIPKSVKLSSVTITYLRKPRQIDYLLGIGSDLPDEIVNKVIADTVQLIKGVIASDSYDKFVKENILIE